MFLGVGFDDEVSVKIGGIDCPVANTSPTEVSCTVGNVPSGMLSVSVHVKGKGTNSL